MFRSDDAFVILHQKHQIIFFFNCIFTQTVWDLVLHGLNIADPSNMEVVPLFLTWNDRFPVLKGKMQNGVIFGNQSPKGSGGNCGWTETIGF